MMSVFFSVSSRRAGGVDRRGVLAVLTALLLVPLIAMLAFSIDVGYLLKKRAELQRAADSAALAAVQDLIPDSLGNQNLNQTKATIRSYAGSNVTDLDGFTVLDSDITIGRFDPVTAYSNFTILNDGVFDTVRVTLRRDASANSPVPLLFGGIFGILDSEVTATATAILQKATYMRPGVGVLPVAVPEGEWNTADTSIPWTIYGDGRIVNGLGETLPGSWGTCNIGTSANSTATMSDQILNGLQQVHLDGLYNESRIPNNEYIDSSLVWNANGDQGLSGGIKSAVSASHGQSRLIPIYDGVTNLGSNLEFTITGWAVATIVDSQFRGSNNTYLQIKKSYLYDGLLRPNRDLRMSETAIQGAYTSPVLVQ